MTLKQLKDLVDHTIKELGPDHLVCFMQGHGPEKKIFDFGDDDNRGYCLHVTPYETLAYVDPLGRFGIPITEVGEIPYAKTPMNERTRQQEVEARALVRRILTGCHDLAPISAGRKYGPDSTP